MTEVDVPVTVPMDGEIESEVAPETLQLRVAGPGALRKGDKAVKLLMTGAELAGALTVIVTCDEAVVSAEATAFT